MNFSLQKVASIVLLLFQHPQVLPDFRLKNLTQAGRVFEKL
ncbi:MAG: hypothetical protein UZ04_CHB001002040 [Chlorobi bacterium OLB4]|nr:MAG: hypothetical protein UZ04_CHB001002040 [Chlorobi bacterium OLB4]